MAKQDINLGTQPTGVGGDTNRSANLKTNANITELYKAMGGSLSGGNGSVLPNSLPIDKGGTGATAAAAARTNLGLGSAATRNVGTLAGNVMEVGAFGWGDAGSGVIAVNGANVSSLLSELGGRTQIFAPKDQSAFFHSWSPALFVRVNDGYFTMSVGKSGCGVRFMASNDHNSGNAYIYNLLTSLNTQIDPNGFIKAASPIVQLYADKIELNDEAQRQNIEFEKLGVGNYLIKNSTGLSNDGWYIEQPKDSNGNIFHAVEYGTHDNGDIWIKTYEQIMEGTRIVADHTRPVDIKEGRFISVRLNALPEDTAAPQNPTIVDNEGNPSPSRLHELEEGVWVISDENAAILEQERLSAMPALKRRQFRLTLAMNGYDLKEIETLIDQIEDPMQRTIAQIEWQDATDFERTNPTLLKMAELMQLTTEQVDQLWAFGLSL